MNTLSISAFHDTFFRPKKILLTGIGFAGSLQLVVHSTAPVSLSPPHPNYVASVQDLHSSMSFGLVAALYIIRS